MSSSAVTPEGSATTVTGPAGEIVSAALDVAQSAPTSSSGPKKLMFQAKWKNGVYDVEVYDIDTIGKLKQNIYAVTRVKPEHQKLILRHRGKVSDDLQISALDHKANSKFMMIGEAESQVKAFVEADYKGAKIIEMMVDDLESDIEYDRHDVSVSLDPKNQAKLALALSKLQINYINPPRPGKKLLVLDIDYTFFDMKGKSTDYMELRRPHLDEFLTEAYQNFDIVIWSQTSWKWIEIKLTEMNLLTSDKYKICFVLDKTSMFRVKSVGEDGSIIKHHVKPLDIIWKSCGSSHGWHPDNTVHVDDLQRNFRMNPAQGIKVSAYKNSHEIKHIDKELLLLTRYFQLIGKMSDFKSLDHSNWKEYCEKHAND